MSGNTRFVDFFFTPLQLKKGQTPVCQRNHLPLRYRAYMTEFKERKHTGITTIRRGLAAVHAY